MTTRCFDSHNFVDASPPEPDLEAALDALTTTCDFCDGLGREPGHKTCRVCNGATYIEIGAQPVPRGFFFRDQP